MIWNDIIPSNVFVMKESHCAVNYQSRFILLYILQIIVMDLNLDQLSSFNTSDNLVSTPDQSFRQEKKHKHYDAAKFVSP